MDTNTVVIKDKNIEDKVQCIKRSLRKRKTFHSTKDKNSLWRRRWILIKTTESHLTALSWVRADNDISDSEGEDTEEGAERNLSSKEISYFGSARRKYNLRGKSSFREDAQPNTNIERKGVSRNDGLPPGWIPRRRLRSRSNNDKNKGKTEHICGVCKKVYGDFNSLKKHKRIHGEKKHICPDKSCGKAFSEASKLKRHMMVHTGEKPFRCPYPSCRRDFGLNYNLRKHIQQIHTGELLACSESGCDRRFMDQNALKTHIKYFHEKK